MLRVFYNINEEAAGIFIRVYLMVPLKYFLSLLKSTLLEGLKKMGAIAGAENRCSSSGPTASTALFRRKQLHFHYVSIVPVV